MSHWSPPRVYTQLAYPTFLVRNTPIGRLSLDKLFACIRAREQPEREASASELGKSGIARWARVAASSVFGRPEQLTGVTQHGLPDSSRVSRVGSQGEPEHRLAPHLAFRHPPGSIYGAAMRSGTRVLATGVPSPVTRSYPVPAVQLPPALPVVTS